MTRASALLALPLLLIACSRGGEPDALNQLDNQLTDAAIERGRDPAVADALAGQIMVDPALLQGNNAPVRPVDRLAAPETPGDIPRHDPVDAATLAHAPAPRAGPSPLGQARRDALTLGALAERQPDRTTAGCAAQISYSARWAARLPAAVPLYPDARVSEAAGNASGGCGLRIVSFVSSAPPAKLIDWYYTQTRRAGYSAEHRLDGTQHILGGTAGADAFVVYARPRGTGSEVDLLTNAGT